MIRVAVLLAFLQLASCLTLPETWKRCHRSDPQINACLKEAIRDAAKSIGTAGVPSLGVAPVEPLSVNEIDVQQRGKGGPVSLKIALKNVKIHGLTTSHIERFDSYLDKYVLDGETLTPSLYLDADYIMDGQILVLPVRGKGKCNITLGGAKVTHDIRGKATEKDGAKYMEITEYNVDIQADKLHGHFENLFNGDKTLGATMNRIINENSHLIFDEIKPSLDKSLSVVFRDYANTIFLKVPFDDIFLP